MKIHPISLSCGKYYGGFSRADLLAMVAAVMLGGFWFWHHYSGERGRILRCQGNLARLGQATSASATDHDDGIPPAAIALDQVRLGWYADLPQYLNPGEAAVKSAYDRKQLLLEVKPKFVCPSDPVGRRDPCSYAMPAHLMNAENWPPNRDNVTGVGLWWDNKTIPALLGNEAARAAPEFPDQLPRLKQSVIGDPANTALLTEFCDRNNTLGFVASARVWGVNQQQTAVKDDPSPFHFGKFNYLMADGHVELLTKLQTGGIGESPAGVWTVKRGD